MLLGSPSPMQHVPPFLTCPAIPAMVDIARNSSCRASPGAYGRGQLPCCKRREWIRIRPAKARKPECTPPLPKKSAIRHSSFNSLLSMRPHLPVSFHYSSAKSRSNSGSTLLWQSSIALEPEFELESWAWILVWVGEPVVMGRTAPGLALCAILA
jgi:hypothetical protein